MGIQRRRRLRTAVGGALLLLLLVAALVFAACGGSSTTASTSPSEVAVLTAEPTESAIPLPTPTVTGTIAFAKVVEQGEYGTANMADIYVVNADGTGLTRLTDDPHWEDHPSWSPDGRRIAYTEYSTPISLGPGLADGNVWVMNADGSGKVRLTKGSRSGRSGGWPSWSPDGKQIAFVTYTGPKEWDWAIDVMNADGSARKQVSDGSGNDFSPSWTPDGRIIFVRDKPAGSYAVNPDGSGLVRLANSKTGYNACSPDGRFLCITDGDRVQVVRMRGGGTPVTLLHSTFDFMTGECGAAWTPDGKALVLANNAWGITGSRLYVVSADGSGLSAVPGVDAGNGPVWRPR